MIIKRGQIYWVRLAVSESDGSEQTYTRPCIIIQNNIGNKHSPTVIVTMLTSKKKNNQPTHCEVKCKGLLEPTTLLAEQIRTIDKKRIGSFIGDCDNMEDVEKCLRISIEL